MNYYVYRISNKILNKHYYGKRYTKINPKDDLGVKYFSSSSDKDFINDQKKNPQNYRYKIIAIFKDSKSACNIEIKLHEKFDVAKNPNFYNKSKQTSSKFDTSGISYLSDDLKKQSSKRMSERNKKNWQNLEYKEKMFKILHSDEVKSKQKKSASYATSKRNQENWKNPEYREKTLLSIQSKESREKAGKSYSDRYENDLDFRQKIIESRKTYVENNKEKVSENAKKAYLASIKVVHICPICNVYSGKPNVVGNHKKKCIKTFQSPKTLQLQEI